MKHIKYLFVLLALTANITYSQKLFTLEQVILNQETISPIKLLQLQWIGKSENISYVQKINEDYVLFSESIEEGNKLILTSLKEINQSLTSKNQDTASTFPLFSWFSESEIKFWNQNKLLKFNVVTKTIEVLNEISLNGTNQDFIDYKKIAYTVENNLFISENSKQIQITHDDDKAIVNGQRVHRNEFGITKGIFWSPYGNFIAFYRQDETMVTDYPLIDYSTHPAKNINIKYPMAGMTSHHVTVGVYNLTTSKTIFLNTGEPKDQYLPGVTWSPDEKYIFINQLNRDQNHLKVAKYDAGTGKFIEVLIEEKNEKYIEPMHGLIFFENEPDIFIRHSRNEGWNHLYLYDSAGNRIKKLTNGEWEVTSFDGFDEEGLYIYFTSTKEDPLERHCYKLNLNSYQFSKLTEQPGNHKLIRNSTNDFYLDEYSSLTVPYKVDLLDKDGNLLRTVYSAVNPFDEYKKAEIKIIKLESNDGYGLFGRLFLPPDFNEQKKYPVVYHVYGGPHLQRIQNEWIEDSRLWLYYMAQQGFIIFTLDNRGTAYRGLEFEQVTFRRLGKFELEDQQAGVEYLKSLPYVDHERMGVYGWSYGGFMAASLMTRNPEIFKVGVAGGSVTDWKLYEVMYTERYMDTPQMNPEGYEQSSLLNYIQNLKGKLLLIHGTSDLTVVPQHTISLIKKAVELGVELEFFPYIGSTHSIKGKDKLHMFKKITNYLLNNLN
ncbi:MAG TPA: DPP IV N-terminal domain-containing protein [Ignavibacteriaceae bacterium]|nr:DPP IV N-terminal domain-containing protein [Ignavibacteriaceae bacterium]